MRSRVPSSSPAPPCSGCATASGSSRMPPRPTPWRARCPTREACTSCRPSSGSARRTGISMRAAPSSGSRAAPRGRIWRAPRWKRSPSRAATCWRRWPPTPRRRCRGSAWMAAPSPITSSASSRPTCSMRRWTGRPSSRRPVSAPPISPGSASASGARSTRWPSAMQSSARSRRRWRGTSGPRGTRRGSERSNAPAPGRPKERSMTRRRMLSALALLMAMAGGSGVRAQTSAPIESELNLITPVSKFIHDAALKAFAEYAKEKWNVAVKVSAIPAGTPIAYGRVVEWKGKPEVDILWGGESALFEKLADQKLLQKVEISRESWESIPASIGKPKPIPLKDRDGYWVGTALEPYGLVYHPKKIQRLGMAEPKEWDDLLDPRLKGEVAQCAPTRSSSSNATYEVILSMYGEEKGWDWLTKLAANTGHFTARSRDVPTVVAKGEYTAGFAVPSYMAFEEKLAGFELKFVAPKNAFVTPEPMAILAGARNPKAARAFIEFLLTERGQKVFMERGLFQITPRYKVQGPPGSTAEMAVEFTGGVRSYFDRDVSNVYDEAVAAKRSEALKTRFRSDIEAVGTKA